MHKKIEAELVSLAHSILQMENRDDVSALHKKAHEIYEKLSVLKFVDSYINGNQSSLESVEKSVDEIEQVFEVDEVKEASLNSIEIKEEVEEKEVFLEAKIEELFNEGDTIVKETAKESYSLQVSLEEEFKDAISADVATQMFERATKEQPEIEEIVENKHRSLNDTLFKNNLQIGLNDRIAFVKHLFEGNQEDFNRVLSQLNSFKNENEAKYFINTLVKPDYDWSAKEEYEQRLISLIERKFS